MPCWCVLVACGRFGFELAPGEAGADASVEGEDASSLDLGKDAGAPPPPTPTYGCGADGGPACDEVASIPEVGFDRGNDALYPGRMGGVTLDRFEVTVARFRAFVDAGGGVAASAPAPGAGAHPADDATGWRSSWDVELEATSATLRAALATAGTFTATPGDDDRLPITGLTWYEAFAFCVWDGGRLPSLLEYQAASVGGPQQRLYPWATEEFTAAHIGPALEAPGSRSPIGDGRWGHADLQGGAMEWGLDYFGLVAEMCDDCVQSAPLSTSSRVVHGWKSGADAYAYMAKPAHTGAAPRSRSEYYGVRCAR
ncbi:MAG: SUMF1/EgtB/PvdO family nonheme iron enzyme [Kofleriaceae bacterium]